MSVHSIEASDLVIGASAAPPKNRQPKSMLPTALKAARRVGADRVEVVNGKIVIFLAGRPLKPNGNSTSSPDSNPWDDVLPGDDRGAD
jgi:hypothetical protein